jgi:hypothetical protein
MPDDQMPVDIDPAKHLTLHNAETVRFSLPLLPIEGLPEPLSIHLDFDRETVEALMERLTTLYARMLPPSATRN